MNGIGVTLADDVEIISAFTATNQTVQAVAADPGWNVVGAFFLSTTTDAQVEILGSVSDSSLSMNVRLFDLTDNEPVSGSNAVLSSLTDTRATSGIVSLTGNRAYQVQAEVVGNTGPGYFGSMKSAALV